MKFTVNLLTGTQRSVQFYQRKSLSSGECANINCQRTHTRTHMYTTGNDDIFDAKLMMPLVHWSWCNRLSRHFFMNSNHWFFLYLYMFFATFNEKEEEGKKPLWIKQIKFDDNLSDGDVQKNRRFILVYYASILSYFV